MSILSDYKPPIIAYVNVTCAQWAQHHASLVNQWGPDLGRRLQQFATGGKMLRGSLVCMTCDILNKEPDEDAVAVAAALELAQAALLIHDDIMDQSTIRRGKPSMHAQYEAHACTLRLRHPKPFGEAIGICAGDIAFFLGFDILSDLPRTSATTQRRLLKTFSTELIKVGLAQMEDVFHESWQGEPTREVIMEQYRHKTARYTFSLPMLLGGMLAEISTETLDQLARLGVVMGILFQIVDDGLDIFHSTHQIGKSAGSDIVNNKKTLHRLFLLEACSPEQRTHLQTVFGNPDVTPEQLDELRHLFKASGALARIHALQQQLVDDATAIIQLLEMDHHGKERLRHLLVYLLERKQ